MSGDIVIDHMRSHGIAMSVENYRDWEEYEQRRKR